MGDRGSLGEARVLDVQVDEQGCVHHIVEGPLPEVGAEVSGVVDRARRRAHMALHTGQHMLSRALADVAGAATVSSRLGETACTIDVDRDPIDERRVAEAEALVNSVIDDDVTVRAFFPTLEELAALSLRRAPKVAENIRVVLIGDFDVSPCGGTHCVRSGQVGLVRVTGLERYKGKSRITFSAGARARRELWAQADALKALGRELTCGPEDVKHAVDRLRRDAQEARDALGRARARLAEAMADELWAHANERGGETSERGSRFVVAVLDDATVELLRAVAARITAHPEGVALLAGKTGEGLLAIVARGSNSTFDCGAFLRHVAAAAGGRGGGRPERAEGRLPTGASWEALVSAALT
jgi:alanyl-tRNA synthetase